VKAISLARPALPLAAIVFLGVFAGCEKKPVATAPPPHTPAPPLNPQSARTFDAAGAHLDAGGDFYLYLRTEQMLERVPAAMDAWKETFVGAAGDQLPLPPAQIDAYYKVLKQAVLDTGVTQLRAFGMSSIELEPGLCRTRTICYTGPLDQRGLLWRLGGSNAPHPIVALDFLPATTVYAGFSDFDPATVWQFVRQVVSQIPDENLRNRILATEGLAQPFLGMPIPELLASLDSEFGLVITADEMEKMTVPVEGRTLEVPRLAGAILVRVKDDKLYDLLANRLQMALGQTMPVKTADSDGLRMTTVQPPQTGLPLTPALARFGQWLVISSSEDLVRQLARTGTNPPPLMRDTPAFQQLAKREKLEANAFTYLSERGANILRTIQLSSLDAQPGMPPQLEANLAKFYDFFSQKFCFSLGRVEKDGYATTMYSARSSEQIVALLAGVPLAIVAGIATPAIVESKHRDEATRSLNELRVLDAAIKQYTTEANLAPGTIIPPSELARYVSETSSLGKRLQEGPVLSDPFGHPYSQFIAGQPPRVPSDTAAQFPRLRKAGFWSIYDPK
jgi:hypothetical protein